MGQFSEVPVRDPGVLRRWRSDFCHLTRWKVDFTSSSDYEHMDRERVKPWAEANAVSSEIAFGTHMGQHAVLLDVDHDMSVFHSSTPGHHHVYIAVHMPWWKYRVLLRVLAWCGIIEKGYYNVSRKRKATFLRTPDTKKED